MVTTAGDFTLRARCCADQFPFTCLCNPQTRGWYKPHYFSRFTNCPGSLTGNGWTGCKPASPDLGQELKATIGQDVFMETLRLEQPWQPSTLVAVIATVAHSS